MGARSKDAQRLMGSEVLLTLVALGIVFGLFSGCLPPLHHPVVTRALEVPEPYAIAYARAMKATMAVQGTIQQHDEQLGIINASVQQAVSLNVIVRSRGTGAILEVTQQVAPTHVVLGTVTVADDWLKAYQAQL